MRVTKPYFNLIGSPAEPLWEYRRRGGCVCVYLIISETLQKNKLGMKRNGARISILQSAPRVKE